MRREWMIVWTKSHWWDTFITSHFSKKSNLLLRPRNPRLKYYFCCHFQCNFFHRFECFFVYCWKHCLYTSSLSWELWYFLGTKQASLPVGCFHISKHARGLPTGLKYGICKAGLKEYCHKLRLSNFHLFCPLHILQYVCDFNSS